MKLLILSGNTGAGHNSCAKAVQEYCMAQGTPCDIEDGLSYISPGASDFVSRWHTRIYRYLPSINREGYGYSEEHGDRSRDFTPVYRLLLPGAERLRLHILDEHYDAVLCTHVFAALILTAMQLEDPLPIRTAFLATDYTCSPLVDKCGLDALFIPHEALIPEFVSWGLDRDKLKVTGIPVRREFLSKEEKARAKEQCGIDPRKTHLLVMCGSMGCGPIPELVDRLQEKMTEDMALTVICGTNESLYKKLLGEPKGPETLNVLKYTDQVSRYMDSADLYLTKPGGISVTEAAAKVLPMAFVDAVAGCEAYNMRYFIQRGGAVTADTPEKLADICVRLLSDRQQLQVMSDCLAALQIGGAARQIYQILSEERQCVSK